MKTNKRNIGSTALLSVMLIAAQTNFVAYADVKSTETTTTTSVGTISEFGPEMIVIKTETSTEPVRYTYTKTTTYVDETGEPVSMTLVKSGLPVTVYYTKAGDGLVATKVIVRKAVAVDPAAPVTEEKETSTTTTTRSVGTISKFGPEMILIKTETSTEPVRYTYTKTTTYVDEAGEPVSMTLVKSGLPVTVYYTKDGDRMVATKVIVRKAVAVDPAPPVVEKKKTTKTTTTEE